MGSTGSDMKHGVFDNIEEASDFLAYRMKDNSTDDPYEYADYEFSYIINGIDYEVGSTEHVGGDEFDYELLTTLETQAGEKAANFIKLYNEAEATKKAKVAEENAEHTRQQELATLARLQEKHGTSQ